MKSRNKKVILTLILGAMALGLTGCSVKENSEKAVENSGLAANNSKKAADNSEVLYYTAMAGGTEAAVKDAIEDIGDAETFALKSRHAVAFIQSLSYQAVVKLNQIDHFNFDFYYERILHSNFKSIWRVADEFMKGNEEFDVTNVKGKIGSLKALAGALHYVNPLCQAFGGLRGGKPCATPIDLIHEAFRKKYVDGYSSKELRPFENEIIKEQDIFLTLSEIRVKFSPVIALKYVSNLDKANLIEKGKMLTFGWKPELLGVDSYLAVAEKAVKEEKMLASNIANIRLSKLALESGIKEVEAELQQLDVELGGLSTSDADATRVEEVQILKSQLNSKLSRKEKSLDKVNFELNSATVKLAEAKGKNADKISKASEKEYEEEFKTVARSGATDSALDYFNLVAHYAVKEREFLRGIQITQMEGTEYERVRPLRYANMDKTIYKLLAKADLSELYTLTDKEVGDYLFNVDDVSTFIESLENLRDNAFYID